MSGYIGNPDAESEHALILAENGVHAARQMLEAGTVEHFCLDCGEDIPEGRRTFFLQRGQKCHYCVTCAPKHVFQTKTKMLDWVL